MTPFGRRVATLVGACLVFDLYGYAVYHAWSTHLLSGGPALVLLSLIAALGIAALVFAPNWIRRAKGDVAPVAAQEPPKRRPWWFPWLLALASIAGGVALEAWSQFLWHPLVAPTVAERLLFVALDSGCIGFLSFTIVRLRRPERFGLAFGVILTIDAAIRIVGGLSLAQILSLRFLYAIVQMGVIYMPICLWAGYLWRRIMSAIIR